jgi:hypothetical protein
MWRGQNFFVAFGLRSSATKLRHGARIFFLIYFNNRKAANLFGMTVRRLALAGNMPYAQLVEENAFTPFVRPK